MVLGGGFSMDELTRPGIVISCCQDCWQDESLGKIYVKWCELLCRGNYTIDVIYFNIVDGLYMTMEMEDVFFLVLYRD